MSEYKNTLNLPLTDFPMKANLSQREPEILKKWQEMDIYATLRNLRKGKEKFILLDGPPYANGHIHIGHAVNKILKDIIDAIDHSVVTMPPLFLVGIVMGCRLN